MESVSSSGVSFLISEMHVAEIFVIGWAVISKNSSLF